MANTVEFFTLRVWKEATGSQNEWRGKIQHVRSGETRYFRDWGTMIVFLSAMVPSLDPTFGSDTPHSGAISSKSGGKRVAGKRAPKNVPVPKMFARFRDIAYSSARTIWLQFKHTMRQRQRVLRRQALRLCDGILRCGDEFALWLVTSTLSLAARRRLELASIEIQRDRF